MPSVKLPLLLASLAALLLLFGIGLLLVNQQVQSGNSNRQEVARELSETTDQLSVVVASGSKAAQADNTAANNAQWAHSDQLARLVAAGDVQVKELIESYSALDLLSGYDDAAAHEVNADWKMIREGLVSFNRSMQTAAKPVAQPETQPETQTDTKADTKAEVRQQPLIEVPQSVLLLASDFEQIHARVIEGTREQALIDVVKNSSLVWTQITNSEGVDLQDLVLVQQAYADDLLQLSGAGTDSSLYGYRTSDLIVRFVQRVKDIQLPLLSPRSDQSLIQSSGQLSGQSSENSESIVRESVVQEPVSVAPAVVSSAFVSEALLQLQSSIAKFMDTTSNVGNRNSLMNWLALAALATALLFLFTAFQQMLRAAFAGGRSPSAQEHDVRKTAGVATRADAPSGRRISDRPMAEPPRSGAMSVRDADQLIQDIDAVASGDLRHSVRVPRNGHAKAIAESANRTAAVMQNLVGMTRGVASRIGGVVQQHDRLGQALAEHDIRRQSETAELSDSISVRSALLDKQQLVLNSSNELIKEIEARSESAVNGVNEVSTSLARVSAQVDVSSGRMNRLLQTAGEVTESTGRLKLLAEQARLQALNVSLKMPEQNQQPTFERDIEVEHNSDNPGASDMFEDIHQLTGKLVQISGDTAALITMLQNDIEETVKSLKVSSDEINESARHTHTSSLVGKELGRYCDQLQLSIKDALSNVETQKSELSQTAKRIVRLDKTGNNTSELALVLTQDVVELQTMASKLQESVAGFQMDSSATTDPAITDPVTGNYHRADSETANAGRTTALSADEASNKVKGEAPLA